MDGIDPALIQRIMQLLQQNGGASGGVPGGPMQNTATMPPMAPHGPGMPGPGPAQLAQGGPGPSPMMAPGGGMPGQQFGAGIMPHSGGPVDPRQFAMPGMQMGRPY